MSKFTNEECKELCKLFADRSACIEGNDSVSFYNRGVLDGISLTVSKLGHAIYFDGKDVCVNDVFESDDYELTKEEIDFASTLNKAENWSFSDERIKKYVLVCKYCDYKDFDKASNIFGNDGEPLPKRIVDLKSTKGLKAYICERLTDCNFHSEACLIEGCCYAGVFRLWDIHE